MANYVVRKPPEFELPVFISTLPAEHRDRRLASATVLFSLLIFIAAAPFARLPLSPVREFIPIYETALTFCDLITAILLFTQFSILRFRALLVLACGYLFTALITVAHMLSFPGLFSPTGMLGAGPQTTAWLYMFWHGVFPITVITYALVKGGARATGLPRASARVALPVSIVSVVAVVVTLTSLATIGDMLLPVIMQGHNYTSVMIFVVSTVWVLSVAAVLVLWARRPHTVLDLWLMVVMCAWIFDLALSAVLNTGRFDLGFYVGRIYGLLASAFVLLVLLFETSALYAKLARSFVTEQKRAESAFREYAEREQLFIAAVESSDDAVVTKNLDGVITGWNQAAERLFGFTPEEAIGKSINIIVPNELRGEVRDILGRIKLGEKVDHHETVRTNKDGQRIDISLSVSPVKSQSGAIIGAAKVARDISARKKAQEALLESEQMAEAIIDTALDAFVQLDEVGTIMHWNPKAEAMFGWSSQEAVGQNLRDLIVPAAGRAANSERLAQFLRESQIGTRGKRYEAPSLRRDGREIKTEVSITPLRRRDSYVINGFIRDITDKLAAEEQLRHAQKMESVGELTGGIAHDFNNMLTVVTSTVDILADAVADKPDLAAIAKLISEAADQGAELTGRLLAFARKQPLQPRETDVNALIMESAKLMRPTFGAQIEIEPIFSNDAWPTLVDPSQLSSALMNLAINARDAMPSGGKLTLETRNVILDQSYAATNSEVQPGNYLMIAVSDTGAGIPEAIRDKVFEPFFTTKEIGKGTGLGLSMVYGFVKQSNGHIKVYSEEGHGTTFRIYLPQSGARQDEFVDTLPESESHRGNETILVVEDDELVRTSVITQLHGLGYKVLSARNAAEALAIVNGGANFDLLFTDVIMPGHMNGPQLAEEIAKRRTSLKVLFTSGYTHNAIIHHGRLDPGVLLLAKPYRKPELARMLRLALASLGPTPSKQTATLSARAS